MTASYRRTPAPRNRDEVIRLVADPLGASFEDLVDQARLAAARGQRETARELYDRAMHALPPDAGAELVASILLGVGATHLDDSNLGAALDCVEAVLAVAHNEKSDVATALGVELRARVQWSQGLLDGARADFTTARERALESGALSVAATAASSLAGLAVIRGDIESAVTLYETSLTEHRTSSDDPQIAEVLSALAPIYADLARWNAAEQAFAEAAQLATTDGDARALLAIELGRAGMAVQRGTFERARASCDRALELARKLDDPSAAAEALALSGVVARELGDMARAERQLDQAERVAQDCDDLLLSAETAREKADLYGRQDRHQETLFALNRAYRLLTQLRGRRTQLTVARRLRRLETGFLDVVRRWAQRIESKDQATAGHCERVAAMTCEIARRMGVDGPSLFWYRVGALLHDIGKLSIPSSILNKTGRLTADEWTLVKRHPIAGAGMLAEVDFPWDVRPIVESHHECWDGSGYPHGLAGTQIPLAARIFCVADVFDALTSLRSFKKALTREEAVEIMRRDVGRQFDPAVFRLFEEAMREGAPLAPTWLPNDLPRTGDQEQPLKDDDLTGVVERASFMRRLAGSLAERRGTTRGVSLLLVDLDHFRLVNESYGRLQGDDILWAVAKILQRGIRGGDLVGRRTGDEFVVLLPDATLAVAMEVAERLRASASQLRCARRHSADETISVSLSIGVASAPDDGATAESLLAAADRALFRAKRGGRDRVVAAERESSAGSVARLQLDQYVGREDELRRIVVMLDAASRGEMQVVSVVGEAGIGKSAFVRQLEPEVRLRSGLMVAGHCSDNEVKTPYAPFAEIISQLQGAGAVSSREWPALSQLVPSLAPLLEPHGDGFAPSAASLQEELATYLRLASAARPVVIVLEDMHWADSATWNAVEYLLATAGSERLLICLTLRSEEARAAAERRRSLAQYPRTQQLTLHRFSPDELKRWVEAIFHEGDLGAEFPAFLYDYTEGIPLYVVHVLRTLGDEGGIWYAGTRWEWRPLDELALPSAIGELLERRLDRLSPTARMILSTAAVIGPAFPLELLLAATSVGEAQVRAAIDEGVAASVIEVAGDSRSGRYAFTHGLLSDACRRAIPERDRQRMHEMAARMLELRAPTAVGEIAGHYHAAGNDEQAYRYAVLAADRAASVYAHDEATACLLIAQRHAPSPAELADLRVRLAVIAETAGRYEYAEELCDLALEWWTANPDAPREIRARRLREQLRTLRGKPPQRALDAYHGLLFEANGAADPRETSQVFLAMARLHLGLADWPVAERLARSSLGALGDEHEVQLQGEASLVLGMARFASAPSESFAFFRDALTLLAQVGDQHGQARAWIEMGASHTRLAHHELGGEALVVAADLARGAHATALSGHVSMQRAELMLRKGAYDEAAESLESASRLLNAVRDEPLRVRANFLGAQLARERGEIERASAAFDATAARARELGLPWLEAASLAGAGHALLTLGQTDAELRWERVAELLSGSPPDWWFPGREQVDALAIRMTLAVGHSGVAFDLFSTSVNVLMEHDPWAATWLTAECAVPLEAIGFPAVRSTVAVVRRRAEALRLTALVARLEA